MFHTLKNLSLKNLQLGSTIIELLIAVMIVGLIVTAVANSVTHSIKNTGESRYRQVASGLGQDVIEYFRTQRNELGIISLHSTLQAGDHCYSTIPALNANPSGACEDGESEKIILAGTEFKRDVAIEKGGDGNLQPYVITITVTVSWVDGEQTRNIELVQQLKQAD